mmetsp:Transcript_22434/g.36921  ORF Transcript_22434/g.36921 Transcript_22434/m.36921 type:complete len:403 (+) Transcript_22434:95-1303(+)
MSSQPNNDNNNCQVVLTLAHLLMQHSLSYDTEKNALLQTSVRCASQLATSSSGGEIHIVLTGSPRPTFAETNALLLQQQQSNNAPNDIAMREGGDDDRPTQLKGSYSIADNIHHSNSNVFNEDEEDAEMQDVNQQSDLQAYIQEFTNDRKASAAETNSQTSSSGGGGHNTSFIRRNTTGVTTSTNNNKTDVRTTTRRRSTIDAGENSVTNNTGPMVGQAVVNAISQSSGVGLQSSRSKLLQGTIDRPLWSQNRWTDGECLFSELVEMVGMKSFEMMDKTKQQQGGPDGAAGIGAATAPKNMSANLITVPATTLREPNAGVSQTTMDEIARGVLRTVKRKKSPPASKVYIVLPGVNHGVSEEKREVVVTFLKQAWEKLEQYNHMIGQPNLMSDADLEFVDFIV